MKFAAAVHSFSGEGGTCYLLIGEKGHSSHGFIDSGLKGRGSSSLRHGEYENGVTLLCEAARKDEVCLVVVGDGPLLANLNRDYPEVRFEGWRRFDEVAGYYFVAHAVAVPSLWYEMSPPPAVLEGVAVGAGSFVVPSDSAPSEYVKDGMDGLVFTSGGSDSLTNVLRRLQDNSLMERLLERCAMPPGHGIDEYLDCLLKRYQFCAGPNDETKEVQ